MRCRYSTEGSLVIQYHGVDFANKGSGGEKIRHKLATRNLGTIQRMADFCGLQRTGALWQKQPLQGRFLS